MHAKHPKIAKRWDEEEKAVPKKPMKKVAGKKVPPKKVAKKAAKPKRPTRKGY